MNYLASRYISPVAIIWLLRLVLDVSVFSLWLRAPDKAVDGRPICVMYQRECQVRVTGLETPGLEPRDKCIDANTVIQRYGFFIRF